MPPQRPLRSEPSPSMVCLAACRRSRLKPTQESVSSPSDFLRPQAAPLEALAALLKGPRIAQLRWALTALPELRWTRLLNADSLTGLLDTEGAMGGGASQWECLAVM